MGKFDYYNIITSNNTEHLLCCIVLWYIAFVLQNCHNLILNVYSIGLHTFPYQMIV